MAQVLYHPVYGYYQQAATPLGRDFRTAPMISEGLGFSLAHSIASVFSSPYNLYEIGPGGGHLMTHILHTLKSMNHLPETVFLFDESAARASDSKRRLDHLYDKIHVLKKPPTQWQGAVVANEYLDAIPFKRYLFDGDKHHEYFVSVDQSHLSWVMKEVSAPLEYPLRSGASYEHNTYTPLRGWLNSGQGMMWLIDYGYDQKTLFHPERIHGTLTCFQNGQQFDDPLCFPGERDITAHVNFSSVARLCVSHDFLLHGYNSQGQFMQEVLSATPHYPHDPQSLKILMQPNEMGEHIKVMV